MAKAFEIQGFDINSSVSDCLYKLFTARTNEIYFYFDQLFGSNDIEILHSARVSSRRLLALFKVFRPVFPQKKYIKNYEPVYRFKSLLGPVRENDVLLKMIGDYISGYAHQDAKALMLFFAKLKNDNINTRAKLFKNKELINFGNERENLSTFFEKYLFTLKKDISLIDKNISFKENAYLIIPYLFEKVKRFNDRVRNHPRNKALLHRMRIKAKPLRYTMEIYLKAFGDDFRVCYEEIKYFVEKTGDIHDADVISERISDYLKELRIYNDTQKGKKEKISSKPLREYLKILRESRKSSFEKVTELLDKWETEDFGKKLIDSLNTDSATPLIKDETAEKGLTCPRP